MTHLNTLSNCCPRRRAGGGVLQDEAQWQEVAVAPPHVQWHRHFRQQVRLPAELLSG